MTIARAWVALALAFVVSLASSTTSAQRRPARPAPAPSAAPAPPAAPSPPSSAGLKAWTNPKAMELAREGIEAKKAGDHQLCVQKDQSSLALEEHPYVRLHLASCLTQVGKLVDALKSSQIALSAAVRSDDEELRPAAESRVKELLPRIPHITFKLPPDSDGIKLRFDGIPVRPALFKASIPVDPGDHLVEASKVDKGETLTFRQDITLREGEDRAIEVLLEPNFLEPGVKECLEKAKTYEERLACVEKKETKPNVRIGIDISGYTDSTNVHVFTPGINASVVSPTGGWNVGGNYLLDVVTAASPDIVSMASGRFRESRHAGGLTGGYKIDNVQVQGFGNVSREPDYLSITGGASVSAELADKHITPRLGYALTSDQIGIRNTPFSQFERVMGTHAIDAGATFVLNKSTLLVTGLSVMLERGEHSKLYRYVPVFAPADAAKIQPGAGYEEVNAARLDARPREVLPRERNRFAIGARLNHRLDNATLRLEERVYADNWWVIASTTDARYIYDLSDRLRVWPHVRLHVQSEAKFYELAYPAVISGDQPFLTVRYRTGDRELSRMFAVTGGAGARYELSPPKATTRYAVLVSGEVLYSHYFMSLFITGRTALYGTLGFEVEL